MTSPDTPPPVLHNTLGDTVPVITDDQGNLRAVAPNGRLVVAAGQIIASAWGNTTYDQSMMTFANAADRANQWPVVQEGSLSFLMDSRTPWIYRQGTWRGLPLGFMNSATGPANQTDITALTSLALVTFPASATRAYRITANCYGTVITAGNAAALIRPNATLSTAEDTTLTFLTAAPVNTPLTASGAVLMRPTTTGTATAQVMAGTATPGVLRVAAGAASILVEDIGG